ncbi:MAG TPA: PQQ-binding-like beta-propeller repeat protein [Candidatus Baltobacteraceae bacterium]|nr:PQQ-binding-like beta-propeller repeat protein [Candidatus Baltobacteraceae bacterium]
MSLSGRTLAALLLSVCFATACTSNQSSTNQTSVGASAEPQAVATGGEAYASGAPAAEGSGGAAPDDVALENAASDDDDWILPGKTYGNVRYTGLDQITPQNVNTLAKAWVTDLADDGEQEASPIVYHGTVYVATPHDSVLALDGTTGELKWQYPYNPKYVLAFAVNRGVGIEHGRIYEGTQDCRVIALDANDGHQIFNVNGCPNTPEASTQNSWFSMASYLYNGDVILGTAGGDFGNVGHVTAFSAQDGHQVWDWQTIPGPGQPGHDTWPGNSWVHGGGAVWGGLAVDPATQAVYVAPGNPGPDLTDVPRKGQNLYTNSVVALDVSSGSPKIKWYYQILRNDTHDADPAMPAVLFDATVDGQPRHLLAIGDKAADFVVLDRTNGKQIYRMAIDDQSGVLTTVPTKQGTRACPNHGGGIEWNGGTYDAADNLFLIPSTEECAVWKLQTDHPKYVPGQPYEGGALPKRDDPTGKLTAIDMGTGKIAWVDRLPYPGQGGVLVTKTGLAFTTDLGGHFYAFDAKTGKQLFVTDLGSSIVASPSAYRANGDEYIALLIGEGGNQQTKNIPKTHGSMVVAFKLGPVASPRVNSAAAQNVAGANVKNANQPPSVGSAPYTPQQASQGAQLYAQNCSSCHGAQLQGVSAPALTGPQMARNKLNLSQLRTIVTTQMPLTAPGSLKPEQYAAIIAYLLSYDCVSHSQVGSEPFPTQDRPEFTKVVFGGRSCPASGNGGHE